MHKERSFGERLRLFRTEKEISIEKLANDTGVSAVVLQAVEKGEKRPRFSYPVINRMADVLGIGVKDLVDVKVE